MIAKVGARLHGFLVTQGFERALAAEIHPLRINGPKWPGLVTTTDAPKVCDPAFCRQQLPAAVQLRGASVTDLAAAALAALDAAIDDSSGPLLLHAFCPDPEAYRSLQGRADLLGRAFVERLRQIRRRTSRRLLANPPPFMTKDTMVIQLVLVGRESLVVSCGHPNPLASGGLDLSPWLRGDAPVAEDRAAPSRAYRKLQESFAWLGGGPKAGSRVVDLGGAPGGWAWTALALGAHVTAVDRSPLSESVTRQPQFESMVLGNAFSFTPDRPVDWLLCDVICEPGRTLDLVERWMKEGLCQKVAATLKFRGDAGYGMIDVARQRLSALGWRFLRIKQMRHHNNEAVILAARSCD